MEAGLDGIWVNHCDRLDAAMADSLRLCRSRSLRFCHLYESFRATRLFRLGPLAEVGGAPEQAYVRA